MLTNGNRRSRPPDNEVLIAILCAVLILLGIAAGVLHAHVVYDDWTCAFSHCVRLKP